MAHLQLHNISEADRSNQLSIKLDPDIPAGYYLRSVILRKQLNFAGELKMAEAAVAIDPEVPDLLTRLAKLSYNPI